MNKTSLAIVALVIVAATTIGFYAFAQDAQASLSFRQSNTQRSSVDAFIINRAGVGNQEAQNNFCFQAGCGG
jgi:hypothetical protein